jgi:hypothetical protein
MGAFSIWHWVILLVIIGGITWIIAASRKLGPDGRPELHGIRGWLVLLAIWQIFVTIKTLGRAAQMSKEYEAIAHIPGARVAINFETAITLALVTLTIVTTVALFRKKHAFKRLFFLQWLAPSVAFALDAAVVSAALQVPIESMLTGPVILQLVINLVINGLWLWYIRVSVRVKNTMVN